MPEKIPAQPERGKRSSLRPGEKSTRKREEPLKEEAGHENKA
jgi:hypothetical protein